MRIGKNIQAHRKRLSISQEDLGNLLYVSRQTVSMWEKGQTQPTVDNLVRLGEIFSVSVDELLNGDIEKQAQPEVEQEAKGEEYEVTLTSEEAHSVRKRFIGRAYTSLLIFVAGVIYSILDISVFGGNDIIYSIVLGVFLTGVFFCIKNVILQTKAWNKLAPRLELTKFKYKLYADYLEVVTFINDKKINSYKIWYCEVERVSQVCDILTFQACGAFFVMRKTELKEDCQLVEFLRVQKERKENRVTPKSWKVVSIVFFILSLLSIFFALFTVAVLMVFKSNGNPEAMLEQMWVFFAYTPLPLTSLICGTIFHIKGLKCKKNIIAGAIILFFLCVYGSFVFVF